MADTPPQAEAQASAVQSMIRALEFAVGIYHDHAVVLAEAKKGICCTC